MPRAGDGARAATARRARACAPLRHRRDARPLSSAALLRTRISETISVGRRTLGRLSDQALSPDAADAVRHLGAGVRAAAHRARQHRRHPVQRRRHDQSGRQGSRSRSSSASTCRSTCNTRTGSADCCRAISAIPTSPRSRRCDEILPRLPISAKLAGLALALRGPVRHSARRDLGGAAEHACSTTCCAWSASAACRCRRSGSAC